MGVNSDTGSDTGGRNAPADRSATAAAVPFDPESFWAAPLEPPPGGNDLPSPDAGAGAPSAPYARPHGRHAGNGRPASRAPRGKSRALPPRARDLLWTAGLALAGLAALMTGLGGLERHGPPFSGVSDLRPAWGLAALAAAGLLAAGGGRWLAAAALAVAAANTALVWPSLGAPPGGGTPSAQAAAAALAWVEPGGDGPELARRVAAAGQAGAGLALIPGEAADPDAAAPGWNWLIGPGGLADPHPAALVAAGGDWRPVGAESGVLTLHSETGGLTVLAAMPPGPGGSTESRGRRAATLNRLAAAAAATQGPVIVLARLGSAPWGHDHAALARYGGLRTVRCFWPDFLGRQSVAVLTRPAESGAAGLAACARMPGGRDRVLIARAAG